MARDNSARNWAFVLLFLALGMFTLVFVLRVPVYNSDEESHNNKYNTAEMTVEATGDGDATCALIQDCTCREIAEPTYPTCGNLDSSGPCKNGYFCCHTQCDQCTDTDGGTSYQCSCRCTNRVFNQECTNVLTTCYTPWVEVRYKPHEPNQAMQDAYNACVSGGSAPSTCRSQHLAYFRARLAKSCGARQDGGDACATRYLDRFPVNLEFEGVYTTDDYSVIAEEQPPHKVLTDIWVGVIMGSVFGSLCCLMSLCAFHSWCQKRNATVTQASASISA